MSPIARSLFTFIGVLLAGLPLVGLTMRTDRENQPTVPSFLPRQKEKQRVFLSLRYTGLPTTATLRHEDCVLASIPPCAASPYECYVELPADSQTIDIEAELHWPENSPENAVTLTLEPAGLPARTETQWTGSQGNTLHTIFSLSW